MENEQKKSVKLFGLIGKNIDYSFSKGYFTNKFKELNLQDHQYVNFDIDAIAHFQQILSENPNLQGLNVTIPYKEAVIPFLDDLDEQAAKIGAVNTIKITNKGLKGFNTDSYGFYKAIESYLKPSHKNALVLGTGGAAKAICYVLQQNNINFTQVSRTRKSNCINYQQLTKQIIEQNTVIINCTPLGTYPDILKKPNIPYQFISSDHLLFDLIYNPEETAFLKEGKLKGATTVNGLAMLINQAEKAWEIWNS